MADEFDHDDFLGPEPDYDAEPEAPPDAGRASALLGRLDRVRVELEEAEEVAGDERRQIEEWLAKRREALGREVEWLEEALRRYHEAVLRRDPKKKTIPLPRGDLSSRMGQPEYVWEDEDAFVEWAKEHDPDLLRRPDPPPPPPLAPDKNAVKAVFEAPAGDSDELLPLVTETGEVVPGVRVRAARRKYTPEPRPRTAEE